MNLVTCTFDRHAPAILAIFNDAIVNSTALYEYESRTMGTMRAWFDAKEKGNFPVLGLEDESGKLMGFASYGTFRAYPGFKYSVEHSVYVDSRFRGRGVGRRLLSEITEAAKSQQYHMMIGGIDAENAASIALHQSLGFTHCASIKQAGFKFGRWLDLEFYQLLLPTPECPVDG
jgi:phosphinothricin acetyltransferase